MNFFSKLRLFTLFIFLFFQGSFASAWGFFGHQKISRLAVFLLPPEMITFYKTHIQYITENAVNPDKRRYVMAQEAPRHYLDLDIYGEEAIDSLPRYWKSALEKYTEDTLMAYGIVPWQIQFTKYQLTKAFENQDLENILKLSVDLGHYIGDGNVPLHTTSNYNGQLTGQHGIHGLWESRLPELFSENYDFFFERRAEYEENTQLRAWKALRIANQALDSVFRFEREVTEQLGERKYGFGLRNGFTLRVYSQNFCEKYHQKLNGQVERQMRHSIKMIADFWFTCWVDAGQPDLAILLDRKMSEEERQKLLSEEQETLKKAPQIAPQRPHEN